MAWSRRARTSSRDRAPKVVRWAPFQLQLLSRDRPAELRLEPVVVATANRLESGRLFDEAGDLGEIAREAVVGPRTRGCERPELGQLVHERVDRAAPVEGITPPGRWKIAVLAETLHSAAQFLSRGLSARSASENSPNALWRIGERALEPALESFVSERFSLILGGDLEERIDPCLNRPLMQKVAAEGVYRADAGEFQLLKRADQPVALLRRRQGSRLFDLAPQAKLHLAGRFLGEGDRHDPVERTAAGADQPDDPADEGGGLAGSRRRLDEEARAELGQDPAACLGVGEIGHGSARTARSGPRFP